MEEFVTKTACKLYKMFGRYYAFDEIYQKTWLRYLEVKDKFDKRKGGNESTFCYWFLLSYLKRKIMENLSKDYGYDREKMKQKCFRSNEEYFDVEELVDRKNMNETIQVFVESLDKNTAGYIVVSNMALGKTPAEIADEKGISKNRVYQILEDVRFKLSRDYVQGVPVAKEMFSFSGLTEDEKNAFRLRSFRCKSRENERASELKKKSRRRKLFEKIR